jgi:hypothetical protein
LNLWVVLLLCWTSSLWCDCAQAEHKNLLRRFGGLAGEHAASDLRCVELPLGMYLSMTAPFLSHIGTGLLVPPTAISDNSNTPPDHIIPGLVGAASWK